MVSCNNCHFDSLLVGGGRRAMPPPMTNFAFLLRRDGSNKIHTGTMQTAVHKDKTFVALAPYGAHSVTKKARACGDCHDNANVRAYSATGKLAITKWDAAANKLQGISGVVPVTPDWRTLGAGLHPLRRPLGRARQPHRGVADGAVLRERRRPERLASRPLRLTRDRWRRARGQRDDVRFVARADFPGLHRPVERDAA